MYVTYKHTTPSGKVYVGITQQKPERRWQNGNGYKDNEHFYRAILKYGWENIKHEIVCTGLNKWQAGKVEQSLIKYFDSTNPDKGYNNSVGGECGALGHTVSAWARREISEATKRALLNPELRQKLSESLKRAWLDPELRRKMSEAHKGKHPSAETRQKMSEALRGANHPSYGKHLSIETRRKISGALKGKHLSAETRRKLSEARKGVNNPNYGKHLSAETRRKISEAKKGKPSPRKGKHLSAETRRKLSEAHKGANNPNYGKHFSAERRQKISEALKGIHRSAETRRKLSEANKGNNSRSKAVICVETGILYISGVEAAKSIGVAQTTISKAVRGVRKTAGGYHWKYAGESDNKRASYDHLRSK